MAMDAKDLRVEPGQGERNDRINYAHGSLSANCTDRNKPFHDMESSTISKMDVQTVRPCAVIGPDRIISNIDTYAKKCQIDNWGYTDIKDNGYRKPPEYHQKVLEHQIPLRNISPRQTYQENMSRVMVPPRINVEKFPDNITNVIPDKSLNKNIKMSLPTDQKYYEVPYITNQIANEQRNMTRNPELCVPNVNPALMRNSSHGWPVPGSAATRPTRPYGMQDVYRYSDYPNGSTRPVTIGRPLHSLHEEAMHPPYGDTYLRNGNVRYEPYPTSKERYPSAARYEYISNYSNPYHPNFPPQPTPHKFGIQKSYASSPYVGYSQVPLKYVEPRIPDSHIDAYQRLPNPSAGFNITYHGQSLGPNYIHNAGNCMPSKVYQYADINKSNTPNKSQYDNHKITIDYDPNQIKNFPMSDSLYLNEMRPQILKGPMMMPNYSHVNMHNMPQHQQVHYRKDNMTKTFENLSHYKNLDLSANNPYSKIPSHYSPNVVSPSDSNTFNDTIHTLGLSQEDCGYVSQTSTVGGRSMDLGNKFHSYDPYKRHEFRYGPFSRCSPTSSKQELNKGQGFKEKGNIDVRQFLQMWNEGDEEYNENNTIKENNTMPVSVTKELPKHYEISTKQEELYVLGLVNVPNEELGKYEHIQKVSKLPENIKGYNSLELLNQFEEVIESSNLNANQAVTGRDRHDSKGISMQNIMSKILSRPISPLDVEAKISQSVIHKEVGCNFEIKPCSPKMLNVEIAAPVQTLLSERTIEKVSNHLIPQSKPQLGSIENKINCTMVEHEEKEDPVDNIPSCKMIKTPYLNETNNEIIKTNYTIQDFESNSGVCLASLPRLDTDIELNFLEVNQQFIDANREPSTNSRHTSLRIENNNSDGKHNLITDPLRNSIAKDACYNIKDASNIRDFSECSPKLDVDNNFTKLSKFRKTRINPRELNQIHNNDVQSMRTDSVIIKNPENIEIEPSFTKDITMQMNPSCDDLAKNIIIPEQSSIPMNLSYQHKLNVTTDKIINTAVENNNIPVVNNTDNNSNISINVAINLSLNNNSVDVKDFSNGVTLKSSEINASTVINYKSNENTNSEIAMENQVTSISSTTDCNLKNTSEIQNVHNDSFGLTNTVTDIVTNSDISMELHPLLSSNEDDSTKLSDISVNNTNECEDTCDHSHECNTEDAIQDLSIEKSFEPNLYKDLTTSLEENDELNLLKFQIENDLKCNQSQICNIKENNRFDLQNVSDLIRENNKVTVEPHAIQSKNIMLQIDSKVETECSQKDSYYEHNLFNKESDNYPNEFKLSSNCDNIFESFTQTDTVCSVNTPETTTPHEDIQLLQPRNCTSVFEPFCNKDSVCDTDTSKDITPLKDTQLLQSTDGGPVFDSLSSKSSVCSTDISDTTALHEGKQLLPSSDSALGSFNMNESICCTNTSNITTPHEGVDLLQSTCGIDTSDITIPHESIQTFQPSNCDSVVESFIKVEPGGTNTLDTTTRHDVVQLLVTSNSNNVLDSLSSTDESNCINTPDVRSDIPLEMLPSSQVITKSDKIGQLLMVNCNIEKCLGSPHNNNTVTENANKLKAHKNNYEIDKENTCNSCSKKNKNLDNLLCKCINNDSCIIKNASKEAALSISHENSDDNKASDDKLSSVLNMECDIPHAISEDFQTKDQLFNTEINVEHNQNISNLCDMKQCDSEMQPLNVSENIIFNSHIRVSSNKELFSPRFQNLVTNLIGPCHIFSANECNDNKNEESIQIINEPNDVATNETNGHLKGERIIIDKETLHEMNSSIIDCGINDYGDKNVKITLENEFATMVTFTGITKDSNKNLELVVNNEDIKDNALVKQNIADDQRENDEVISNSYSNILNEKKIDNIPIIDYVCSNFCNSSVKINEKGSSVEKLQFAKANEIIDDENENNKLSYFKNIEEAGPTRKFYHKPLKRSFSESSLYVHNHNYINQNRRQEIIDNIDFTKCSKGYVDSDITSSAKRKKYEISYNANLVQNCNVIQYNRRNSTSTIHNDVSFCIYIADDCIIAEEPSDIFENEIIQEISSASTNNLLLVENELTETMESESDNDLSENVLFKSVEDNDVTDMWVDDVACMETVVSDDMIETSCDLSESETSVIVENKDNTTAMLRDVGKMDENETFNVNIHTAKLKNIYGNKDIEIVETLYRTPQMNVNNKLNEKDEIDSENYNNKYDETLENSLSEERKDYYEPVDKNAESAISPTFQTDNANLYNSELLNNSIYIKAKITDMLQSEILNEELNNLDRLKRDNILDNVHHNEELKNKILNFNKISKDTSSSPEQCENFVSNSSSPEVTSTTTEEKKLGILLKIKNYNGSRVSVVDNNSHDTGEKKLRCKFTELTHYVTSVNSKQPLITKAAKKYIPPLDDYQDLKVKLILPPESLLKLKELKFAKEQPKKSNEKDDKTEFNKLKKIKPNFEDVLKSIDDIQYKQHKSKKTRKVIPKVVIKKNCNGSHYASTSSKEYNPDMTGRKWQPWVFIEKNYFIDKLVLKNNRKVVYCHNKNMYVPIERDKYPHCLDSFRDKPTTGVSTLDDPVNAPLRYTIRLKHN